MKNIELFESWLHGQNESKDKRSFVRGLHNDFKEIKDSIETFKTLLDQAPTVEDAYIRKTIENTLDVAHTKSIELEKASERFLDKSHTIGVSKQSDFIRLLVRGRDYIFSIMDDLDRVLGDEGESLSESMVGDVLNSIKLLIRGIRATFRKIDQVTQEINTILKDIESGKI